MNAAPISAASGLDAFSIAPASHRALGSLLRLSIGNAPALLLTPNEAAILSRALSAVREARSAERIIFLSPIASDGDFTATVEGDGIRIGEAEHWLAWPEVERLALALAVP